MNLEQLLNQYGYIALIIGSILEGETILTIAGVFVRQGYLDLLPSIICAALGGIIGDQFFFFLGRFYGQRVLTHWPSLQPVVMKITQKIYRHNTLIILGVRFMYGFRIAGPIAIGMSNIPIYRFLILNTIGALLWASLIISLGYLVGSTLQWFWHDLQQYIYVILFAVIIMIFIFIVIYRKHH